MPGWLTLRSKTSIGGRSSDALPDWPSSTQKRVRVCRKALTTDVCRSPSIARRDHVTTLLGRGAPYRMTDGRTPAYRDWSEGYDPASWLDRAINATREAVFPLHGLDPLPF